jgi:hypothetical protein
MSRQTPLYGPGEGPRRKRTNPGYVPPVPFFDERDTAGLMDAGITYDDDSKRYRWRDKKGRFQSSMFYPKDVEEAAGWRAIERAADERFGEPNPRPPKELGWLSRRELQDKRRERDRTTTCVVCGKDLPKVRRSDMRTCSGECRKALSRQPTANVVRGAGARASNRHGSAGGIEVVMEPKHLSPLTEVLIAAVEEVWKVAMPAGYPDERDWRQGQAAALHSLWRDEHDLGRRSVAMFNKRARSYIRAQERLSRSNTEESK